MLDHFTQYVGSSPEASPAVLCGIAHMQTGEGVWYPVGGTRAVPEALVKLGAELGVEFRTGHGVARILTRRRQARDRRRDRRRASGRARRRRVELPTPSGRTANCSAATGGADGSSAAASYEPACSGVVLYLGLDRAYDHLLHHNFVFSRDPHEEFDSIYRKGEPAPDPTCYVAAPARTEPGRRAARRRRAVCAGPHALPAAAPRLEDRCCPATAA